MPSDHTNPSAQRNSSSIPFRTIVYYHSGLTTSPISNNNRPKPLDNMQDFSFKRFCADTAALVNVSITPSSVAFPRAIFLAPIRFSFPFFAGTEAIECCSRIASIWFTLAVKKSEQKTIYLSCYWRCCWFKLNLVGRSESIERTIIKSDGKRILNSKR